MKAHAETWQVTRASHSTPQGRLRRALAAASGVKAHAETWQVTRASHSTPQGRFVLEGGEDAR